MLVIGVFSTNVGGHRPKFWYLVENRANKVSALDSGSCGGKESASGGAPGVSTKILPFIERIHFPKIGPICGYIFDNQRIANTEVIDVLHGGGAGLADGGGLIGRGGAGDEGDGGGEGDADEVGIDHRPGQGEGNVLVDRILSHLEHGGRGDGGDGIDVAEKSSGFAIEHHILNAGHGQKGKPHGSFIGAGVADEFEVDAVAVVIIGFRIAAAHDAVIIGHQERTKTAVGIVGEVVTIIDLLAAGCMEMIAIHHGTECFKVGGRHPRQRI